MISLRPIGDGNRGAVEALRVSPIQEQFVASVAESLVEAVEDPGGRGINWGIYADEIPAGFVMISDEVDGPGYVAQYLWRLLIDRATRVGATAPRRLTWSSSTSAAAPGRGGVDELRPGRPQSARV